MKQGSISLCQITCILSCHRRTVDLSFKSSRCKLDTPERQLGRTRDADRSPADYRGLVLQARHKLESENLNSSMKIF